MIGFGLLAALPWALVGLVLLFGVREPRPLPPSGPGPRGTPEGSAPTVTVIVPARDEARNIERCLASLSRQDYPAFSVIVVDDRSRDGTAEAARRVPVGQAREIRIVEGAPLPEGWFGKPWACAQGAALAEGDLLLFTDADTRHDPGLLARAVAALGEDAAAALTLHARQELGSFGERLVQPHLFALIALRFRRLDRPMDGRNTRDAIANGQYILVTREAYLDVGGHGAVRNEVVEDLRMAQVLTGAGHRLTFRSGTDAFTTRMYRSLGEVVDGWTKNVAVGGRQSAGRWGPFVAPGIAAFLFLAWILPPLTLGVIGVGAAIGATPPAGLPGAALLAWAGAATGLGMATWAGVCRRFEVPLPYAVLYPFGAGIAAYIALRSWVRGEGRILWKGRQYAGGGKADAGRKAG
jgi:chlorobactene glucosyltransferase